MVWERHTTDMMCCGVFAAFVFGMIILSGVGISNGSPSIIFTPFDSDGNMCGQDVQTMSNATIKTIRDFSDYKYKFFTNLQAFSVDTDKTVEENAEDLKKLFENPLIYYAVCVKECPTQAMIDANEKIECMVNNDVTACPGYESKLANIFYDTKETFNYCIPNTDEAETIVKELYAELDENIGGFGNYINDIKDAWFVMLVMAIVSFMVTVFYVWLL